MSRLALVLRRFGCAASLCAAASLLAGCEGARTFMGMDKSTPDEFAVVARPPLTMPPDFQLRPPRQAGTTAPTAQTQTQQARQTVFGVEPAAGARNAAPTVAQGQTGEGVLLARAGVGPTDAGIRGKVDRESAVLTKADETFLDRLLKWRTSPQRGEVVDAAAEARRLKENQALGRPVTEGETPTIERKKRGLLQGIF
ncbi:MAG: DUF3035 domain-containing protein [Alphaproteobacteria bacterium]|nr:DUF3035 domain-containing protein [Alphaproteobacteria bacterium]